MKDFRTIKPENVYKAIKKHGYFYILAEKYYDEDYTGPKYIIATEDENFMENYPEFEDMVIMSTEKFLMLADAINESILNDHREFMRKKRYHNLDGYYEDIDEMDEARDEYLSIRDIPLNPVEDEVNCNLTKEMLLEAMKSLKEKPRRRLIAYFFEGLTFREISALEGVADMTIRESINGAIKKLKKVL